MLDGRGHLLGRLAAIVAKQVLLGKSALSSAPLVMSPNQRSVMSNNHHLSFESHDCEINPMHRSETRQLPHLLGSGALRWKINFHHAVNLSTNRALLGSWVSCACGQLHTGRTLFLVHSSSWADGWWPVCR